MLSQKGGSVCIEPWSVGLSPLQRPLESLGATGAFRFMLKTPETGKGAPCKS